MTLGMSWPRPSLPDQVLAMCGADRIVLCRTEPFCALWMDRLCPEWLYPDVYSFSARRIWGGRGVNRRFLPNRPGRWRITSEILAIASRAFAPSTMGASLPRELSEPIRIRPRG